MPIYYNSDDQSLSADEFLRLAAVVWKSRHEFSHALAEHSLRRSQNITARNEQQALVACARIVSDGYFFSAVSDLMINPDWKTNELSRKMFELIHQSSPTSVLFAVQRVNSEMMSELGWNKGPDSYLFLKPLPAIQWRQSELPS